MKSIIPTMLVLLAAAPAAAQATPPYQPYTLGSWIRLQPEDRDSTIVAAIEGLLLAATGPAATAPRINQDCLAQVNVELVERDLTAAAAKTPRASFLQSFLGATKCSRS